MNRRARRDRGFTLVELMVTMVAASLVAVGTFTFFAGQQQIYEAQTKMLGLQESLWSSLDTVARYVRSSGAGMDDCVRADADGSGADTGDPPPGGATAPQTGLRAFFEGQGAIRIAPLWIQNGAAGASDAITIAYGRGASGNFRDAFLGATISAGGATANISTLLGQSARFVRNEFILLVDEARSNADRGCSLFRITDVVSPTDSLLHTNGSPWNATSDLTTVVPFAYPGGTTTATGGIRNFGELVWIRLAIDTTGSPAIAPRLTMDRLDDAAAPQVLAEGIEDMQIAYGCDLGPDALPDGILTEGTDPATRLTDEWTFNEAGDVISPRCQRPDAVRITLVARTATTDPTLSELSGNRRPAAEDGLAGTTDQFRHRTVTSTVRLRN